MKIPKLIIRPGQRRNNLSRNGARSPQSIPLPRPNPVIFFTPKMLFFCTRNVSQWLAVCLTFFGLALSLCLAGRGKVQPVAAPTHSPVVPAAPVAAMGHGESSSQATFGPLPGYVVHRDPKTGKFVASGESLPLSGGTSNAFSTSGAGLDEVIGPVQGRGVMINLRGRFQHGMVAQLDSHGALMTDCQATEQSQSHNQSHHIATGKE